MNLIKIPKNSIITGAYALSMHGVISFLPSKITIEMPMGTNVSYPPYEKYQISTQAKNTIFEGATTINGFDVYSIERLFIEFDKFPLENTIKLEALKKLEARCNPHLVRRIYEKLKGKRRGLDHDRIQKYLQENNENILELFINNGKNYDILREYLISRVSDLNIPVLIKGGSSIELFSDVKRSTYDVDTHTGVASLNEIINKLADKKYEIWFECSEKSKEVLKQDKQIYKIDLVPKTRNSEIKKFFDDNQVKMQISFNTTYSADEIEQIILDYKLSHQRLRYLTNQTCLSFSREMLLAEKFQSLISKPEESTRTKDLIDLILLWNETFNEKDFIKWFFRKYSNQRFAKTKEEIIEIVKSNKDKELVKIKANFKDALIFYDLKTTYQECIDKYHFLADLVIKTHS